VVDKRSVSPALNETGLAQYLEMVREGRLRKVEELGDLAHAKLSAAMINQVDDPQTHLIRKRLEALDMRIDLVRRQSFMRRSSAGAGYRLCGFHRRVVGGQERE